MRAGILCVYGYDSFVSAGIRWVNQHAGETRSWSNHYGVGFEGEDGETVTLKIAGELVRLTGPCEFVIHSTGKGTHVLIDWEKQYDTPKQWAVVVIPRGTTDQHALKIFTHAKDYLGRAYDHWSIALQLLDGLLGKLAHRDVYAFRRLRIKGWRRDNRYNICTWLMAHTWWKGRAWKIIGRLYQRRMARVGGLWMRRTAERPEIKPVELGFLNPDHVYDDAFQIRPEKYHVARAVGMRPPIPAIDAAKIETDLAAERRARLDGRRPEAAFT